MAWAAQLISAEGDIASCWILVWPSAFSHGWNLWPPLTTWPPHWIKWDQTGWIDDVWCTNCWMNGTIGALNWSNSSRWAHLSNPFSSARARRRSGLRHVLAKATWQQNVTWSHAERHRSNHDENTFRCVSIFLEWVPPVPMCVLSGWLPKIQKILSIYLSIYIYILLLYTYIYIYFNFIYIYT